MMVFYGVRPAPTALLFLPFLLLAVITALNIADELFRCRESTDAREGRLAVRAGELERLLDSVLMT